MVRPLAEQCGDTLVVHIRGSQPEDDLQAFGAGLSMAVQQARLAGLAEVVVDLSQLRCMSSVGLRMLASAKRDAERAGIAMSLASPGEVMRQILAISHYDKLFRQSGASTDRPTSSKS